MSNITTLNVGLIKSGTIYDEVVKEILAHQGIIFTEINKNSKTTPQTFPCVIASQREKTHKLASKLCSSKENIIIANETLPLDNILKALSGEHENLENPLHPYVNEYEASFIQKIAKKYWELNLPFVQKWYWPNFADACCVLTHDIDWLYYSPFHRAVFKRRPLYKFLKLALNSLLLKKNYGDNISYVIEEEEKRNFKSSFYFTAKYGPKNEKNFTKILEILRNKEFEIGLHGYYSHVEADKLKRQKETLEKIAGIPVEGIRQHELNFSVPQTWRIEEQSGFSYDLTFFFNKKLGFRSGLCLPYHPIDKTENKKLNILEIPTSFMDFTVLHNYMSYEETVRNANKILKTVEDFNGVFLTCFHNTYLNEETFPEICDLYKHLLDYVKAKNYWVATAKECCSWWIKREQSQINITVEGKLLKGHTSTYPLPLVINSKGKKRKIEIGKSYFEIKLDDNL